MGVPKTKATLIAQQSKDRNRDRNLEEFVSNVTEKEREREREGGREEGSCGCTHTVSKTTKKSTFTPAHTKRLLPYFTQHGRYVQTCCSISEL
jgi:hypothetical protein